MEKNLEAMKKSLEAMKKNLGALLEIVFLCIRFVLKILFSF
jgi:hypothetical protein